MKINAAWLAWPEVKTLAADFANAGFELRFVGGCVRDTLLNLPVAELDGATNATPEEITQLLENAGLRAIPTGLAHGTVTALVDKKTFEITTLRKDVSTDGRHAEVAFTGAWEEDAKRRDFTMNALYAGMDGTLYDYVGGAADCAARQVRFIGNAAERIREDYLRILRYFRFVTHVGAGKWDEEALTACRENRHGIDDLSGERISSEILKILASKQSFAAVQKMQQANILAACLGLREVIVEGVKKLDAIDAPALVKLASIIGEPIKVKPVVERLRLSNKQAQSLFIWLSNRAAVSPSMTELAQKKLMRKLGAADYVSTLQLAYALQGGAWDDYTALLATQHWPVPVFPVAAQDLLANGFSQGKALGEALKKLEIAWEDGGYVATKEELLTLLG